MYAKLFTSIYQGTLRGNSHGLLVFTNLLAHADKDGLVDIHPKAIAEEVGLSIDEVKASLLVLESPDDESRSPEEQGRRIVRMDEHRAWGWRVVNYVKYRAIRNEEDRREQNRASQERWREKNKPPSATVSQAKPKKAHTEEEADAEALKDIAPTVLIGGADAYRVPDCPYQDLLDIYHQECPAMSRVLVMSSMRQKHLMARWRQVCAEDKLDKSAALDWFRWYFQTAGKSKFLTGCARGNGDRAWKADFEWLVNGGNFAKVVEGRYSNERSAA